MLSENHIFLSYSRKDRVYANNLARWLKGHGVKTWFDDDIDYGQKWKTEIQDHLDASQVVLVIMSKRARESIWVRREIIRAKRRKIPILSVLLEPDGLIDSVKDIQSEPVFGGQMPSLRFSLKLPGFLVSESDLANALTPEQLTIARRIISAAGFLRPGSKGPGVAALQVELLRVGLDPGPINGVFGQQTAIAVREFQARRSAEGAADGVVGPLTWMILAHSFLGDLTPSKPATKKGRKAE